MSSAFKENKNSLINYNSKTYKNKKMNKNNYYLMAALNKFNLLIMVLFKKMSINNKR